MKKLRALYYPYSRAININSLKKAVLLFDEIAFVDNEPDFIRGEIIGNIVGNDFEKDQLNAVYSFLKDEKFISIVKTDGLMKEYDEIITNNVVKDILNDEYCKLAISESSQVWNIRRSRIPDSFFKEFYPGAGTFSEAISLQSFMSKDVDMNILGFKDFRWGQIDKKKAEEIYMNRYRNVIGGNPFIELESYKFPFLHASSLRINESLLLSSLNGYVPYTDSILHNRLLLQKVKIALNQLIESPELNEIIQYKLPIAIPEQDITMKILDEFIPNEELEKRSFEELISYRNENLHNLKRFREKVSEISSEIDISSSSSNYYLDIQRIFNNKIIPEISVLEGKLKDSYKEFFGSLIMSSIKVTGPVLATTFLSGLTIPQILLACGAAELGVFNNSGLESLKKLIDSNRETNGYSYLLNI